MKRRLIIGGAPAAIAAGIAIFVAGCGAGTNTGPTGAYGGGGTAKPASGSSVRTARTPLGTVLVDGQGRTLYLFEKDSGAASSCTGACASIWPPLTTASASVSGKGVNAAKV